MTINWLGFVEENSVTVYNSELTAYIYEKCRSFEFIGNSFTVRVWPIGHILIH